MALAFTVPVHVNSGLIFAPQDYASAPTAFAGVGVTAVVRWRGRYAGVGIDNNGFMANDSDPNGDPLSYRIVSSVSNGVLQTYLGGAFTYTPNPGFVGIDSFVYQLYAGGTAGGTGTVTLAVGGAFAGVAVTGLLRLRSQPALFNFAIALQAAPSRLRLRSAAAVGTFGSVLQPPPSVLRLRGSTAVWTTGGVTNQLVNGDFAAPDISPWVLGPNTVATLVNGQVRLAAIVASPTPIYVYQRILTVAGTPYVLDADVIAGAGFGVAGIAVADTLIGSGGSLSYGGHINATYNANAGQTFVALHYTAASPGDYVAFDAVALVGLTAVAAVNAQAVPSLLRLRSAAATLGAAGAENRVVLCSFTLDNVTVKKRRRTVLEEKTVALLSINYLDALGVAAGAPASVTYRIDCMTTGTVIRAVQALAPAASIEVTLTGVDNTLINQDNRRELRRVTVQALYASGEAVNAQLDYLVLNLSGVV